MSNLFIYPTLIKKFLCLMEIKKIYNILDRIGPSFFFIKTVLSPQSLSFNAGSRSSVSMHN